MKYDKILSNIAQSYTLDGIFIIIDDICKFTDSKIMWINDALINTSGYKREELIGKKLIIFRNHESNEQALLQVEKKLRLWQFFQENILISCKDNSSFRVNLRMYPITDKNSLKRYWVGVQHDASGLIQTNIEHVNLQKDVQKAEKRLWAAIEALPEAFAIFDKDQKLVNYNSHYKKVYAASAPAIFPGASLEDILRFGCRNGQYPEAVGREDEWVRERINRHLNPIGPIDQSLPGDRFLQIHEVLTETGDIVGFRSDVTELRRQKDELEKQTMALRKAKHDAEMASQTDYLTGLNNRRGLDLFLGDLEQRIAQGFQVALLHVDLDRFKVVNDMFGHTAGDYVLCTVAKILKNSIRPEDCVARLGGDEFAIATLSKNAKDSAERIAKQIIAACQAPIGFNGKQLHFGASIGIAVNSSLGVMELMENADIALYHAKQSGRNQYAIYKPQLRLLAEKKNRMVDALRTGLAEDRIHPHFQPQVSANGHEFVGVEALVRWKHPTMGWILPETFLPIAEELGLIQEIDELMLRKSFAMVERLSALGIQIPRVSVNVSYSRLLTSTLLESVKQLMPWPCKLAFELLETIDYDQNADSFDWIIDELKSQGVEIELDDFGSGRASITTLLKLRPDRIKIDRQLVAAVASEVPGANPLVKTVGEMGKALGIQMTAEGVETEIQARVLQQLGCDVLQGYLFSTALSENDLTSWLTSRQSNTTQASAGAMTESGVLRI